MRFLSVITFFYEWKYNTLLVLKGHVLRGLGIILWVRRPLHLLRSTDVSVEREHDGSARSSEERPFPTPGILTTLHLHTPKDQQLHCQGWHCRLGKTFPFIYGRKKYQIHMRGCHNFKPLPGQWYSNFSPHVNCPGIGYNADSDSVGLEPEILLDMAAFAAWTQWAESLGHQCLRTFPTHSHATVSQELLNS